VAPLVTTSGSQTAAVAKPPLNNAAAAATQLLLNHPIGSNVPSVKPPGITATKSAQAAEAPDICSWVRRIKPRFNRAALKPIGETDRPVPLGFTYREKNLRPKLPHRNANALQISHRHQKQEQGQKSEVRY